jgi:hypothetical protein
MLAHGYLGGITRQISFETGINTLQLRMFGQIGDILADAFEE